MTPAETSPAWIAGVVGARGIGAVHAREIVAGGCAELFVAGRTFASARESAGRLALQCAIPVHAAADIAGLAAQRPAFISICSPTELHAEHCRQLRASGAFILVEKPMLWQAGLTRQATVDLAKSLFDAADGRLAVNHPTGLLGADYAEAAGWRGPLKQLTFRYRTRGGYRGEMIAVDLLPHALSLLLTLGTASGTGIGTPSNTDIRRGDDRWNLDADFGAVRCRFEFSQDPALAGSELSFAVNGVEVRREQEAAGGGFKVFLAFAGRRVEVPNPMSASIQGAIAAARAGRAMTGEAAYSTRIIAMMADLLLD